jgi:hypothetical protein
MGLANYYYYYYRYYVIVVRGIVIGSVTKQ